MPEQPGDLGLQLGDHAAVAVAVDVPVPGGIVASRSATDCGPWPVERAVAAGAERGQVVVHRASQPHRS